MGSTVTLGQQEDLGILCRAALRHVLAKEGDRNTLTVLGAVAHVVPLLAEGDIRQLIWDADHALSDPAQDRHAWTELLMVLRRVDRP